MRRHATLMALVFPALPLLLGAGQPATVLDRAASEWAAMRSARGSFEMTVTNPLTGTRATSRGDFQQQRPNRLAIAFTDPRGDAIVADGTHVWVWQPSINDKSVMRLPASDLDAAPVDVGRLLESHRTRYDITDRPAETLDGRPVAVYQLVPRRGTTAAFVRATVWVDAQDAAVRQMEVVDGNQFTRRIKLREVRLNVPVQAAAFRFSPPRGVRIVDRLR
jgi:outer membrane lipoprotein carrier protein